MRTGQVGADVENLMSASLVRRRIVKYRGRALSPLDTDEAKDVSQVSSEMRGMSVGDHARLRKVAMYCATGDLSADDLLQEAFCRALAGTRRCPRKVDVVRFLAEAIRSLAHGEREKLAALPKTERIDPNPVTGPAVDPPSDRPDAEERLLIEEKNRKILGGILGIFEDDPVATLIIEGIMDELSVDDMLELTGISKTAYDTKRKLIRRRVDKAYPEGMRL
ncbi:MAG: hypothetical protein CVT82_15170 [Alphaproteobacteria bacterium HGW-Alphaproteobacteria-4]|jgi:RNA polymerase sigma-70 factor (ECF subfamily)|nr:MAG: hypothetical protein CVT82_15170 [Alphaproteobacteria bacterium HGW-Alphaproteobacteria-4]